MLVDGGQRLWPPLLQTEFENQAYTKYHFLTCEKRNVSLDNMAGSVPSRYISKALYSVLSYRNITCV